jgi:Tfp pilus assembly protein PilF
LRRLGAVEERFGDEPDVFVLMAGAAQALGRHDDAITYYEKARTLAPESEAVRDALEAARRRSP